MKLIIVLFLIGIVGYTDDGMPIFEASEKVTVYEEGSVVGDVIYEQHGDKPPVIDKTGKITEGYFNRQSLGNGGKGE